MRRSTMKMAVIAALGILGPAATVRAQGIISLGVGGGLSQPFGGFSDRLDAGWHGMATLAVAVPLIPVGVRGDVAFNSFGFSAGGGSTRVTSATINPVFR